MAKLTTFEVGYCRHPGCMALKGAAWKSCRFPARAWLIEAKGRRWLWDTGYAEHFERYTRRGLSRFYALTTPVHFDPAEALVHQLAQQGLRPSDIQGLIVSHFHGDHIAGLRDFPNIPAICSAEAWQSTRGLTGFAALKRAFIPELIPNDFDHTLSFMEAFDTVALPPELAPFTHAYALPGSHREVLLVPLPGHAAGHIGAFVQTQQGWTLLASDAAWSPTSYREPRGPSRLAHLIMDDTAAYYRTLDRLHQLHKGGQVNILLCHEGDL